ncbi:MAG: MBL fold metallo-hydrolase [Gemmatimonadales bacterium]
MTRSLSAGAIALTAFIALPAVVPSSTTRGVSATARSVRADSTVVLLLGTGFPRPLADADGPATVVLVGSRVFLFDAGPDVMHQFAVAGLPLRGPEALFITHLHSDHTIGLPDVMLTTWVMGRRRAIPTVGPPGLAKMVDALATAYAEDIDIRTHGLERDAENGWRLAVREATSGIVYDSGGVRVTAFRVQHGSWPTALGYRVDAPGRSIVISGDTRPSDDIVREASGVDVLVHEVYPDSIYAAERGTRIGDTTNDYFRSFHTSDVELGRLAARANPKLLVLTHIVRMGATDDALLRGVRAGGFTGKVVVGKDLGRY